MTVTRINPTQANSLKDQGNGTDITAQYSGPGIAATNWACMWDTNSSLQAVSTRNLAQKMLNHKDINVGNITIPNVGYSVIGNITAEVNNGAIPLAAQVLYWGSNSGAFGVQVLASGSVYVVGTPGVTVTNLRVRVNYIA